MRCLLTAYFIIVAFCFQTVLNTMISFLRPPLWSSGQSFWLQIQRFQVRSPALPDFLGSKVSTQPREDNRGATRMKKYLLRYRKPRLTTVGIRCADHATSSNQQNVSTNFAEKRRSLGRYSSLAD
jgi:hypothetical protein